MAAVSQHSTPSIKDGLLPVVRRLYHSCFTDPILASSSDDAFLDLCTFCHEPDDCIWILIHIPLSDYSKLRRGRRHHRDQCSRGDGTLLVGMATAVPYTKSLYAFNLCVLPELRGRGLGELLGRSLQLLALQLGLPHLSGSVDSSQRQLLGYYIRRGGHLVQDYCSSQHSSSAAAAVARDGLPAQLPPTVKVQVPCGDGALIERQLQRVLVRLERQAQQAWMAGAAAGAAAIAAVLGAAVVLGAVVCRRARLKRG